MQNLGALKQLRILSIQSNRLTRIEGLEELTELEELYLSHNGIGKLEGLESNVSDLFLRVTFTNTPLVEVENIGCWQQSHSSTRKSFSLDKLRRALGL